jgi:hypothetical protein
MRYAGQYALRFAVFCHRWLGLAVCLLFVLWFASGIVMMYWGFPEITPEQRFDKAEALPPAAIRISPAAAYRRLELPKQPDTARLAMLDGRPAYHFRTGRSQSMVYADSGDPLAAVPQDMALRIAARWAGRPAREASVEGPLRDPDQWTVSGEFRARRPLLKFSWGDGQQVYISAATGEVVQYTTRDSRLAAYFGAIPHWLYWTPLRKNGKAWNKVVIWLSGIGTCVTLLGLMAGWWMYSSTRRYRYRGQPSSIPYSGQKRWHMLFGLLFGTLACTWAFSGLLSMEPFEFLQGNYESAFKVETALRGGPLRLDAFASKQPGEALEQAGTGIKELEFGLFDGEPYYFARQSPRSSRIVPVRGHPLGQFDGARILQIVRQASQPAEVEEARVVSRYDAYYLDRRGQHPLPAFLVRLNDPADSLYYIDLQTARLVEAYDRRSRWNRWLYHGLHSWNLPWLYRHRPAWDILVMLGLLAGLSLSITAVILGFQFLRRTTRSARVTFDDTRVPTT